jgi:hypothetical protein
MEVTDVDPCGDPMIRVKRPQRNGLWVLCESQDVRHQKMTEMGDVGGSLVAASRKAVSATCKS